MLTSLHSRCFMSRRGIFITLTSLFFLTSSLSVAAQKTSEPKKDGTKKQDNRVADPLKVNVSAKKKEEEAKAKAKSKQLEDSSKALRKWIDEDVSYIITNEERAAFKGLKTDEERESFIESF